MTFDNILDGASVYLDANILIYFFNGESQDCTRLVERCKQQHLYGLVSTLTVIEVCHKAMCAEAEEETGKEKVTPEYLRRHPALVRSLRRYAAVIGDLLLRDNLGVIEVTANDILRSGQIRERYGLLTTDSIVAQIILDYGIPAIATNDPDFERVEGVEVFKPSDL